MKVKSEIDGCFHGMQVIGISHEGHSHIKTINEHKAYTETVCDLSSRRNRMPSRQLIMMWSCCIQQLCTVTSSDSIKVSGCVGGAGVGVGTGWIYTDLINLTESGSLWLGGGGGGHIFICVVLI